MKKEWKKPELTVLGRGESEENVLIVCKNGDNHSCPNGFNCHSIKGNHDHHIKCNAMECS